MLDNYPHVCSLVRSLDTETSHLSLPRGVRPTKITVHCPEEIPGDPAPDYVDDCLEGYEQLVADPFVEIFEMPECWEPYYLFDDEHDDYMHRCNSGVQTIELLV